MAVRDVNAVEIGDEDVGCVIEYDTVITPDMEALGFGTLGEPVAVKGWLLAAHHGNTVGRSWAALRVCADSPDSTVLFPRFDSVLGANHRVRLSDYTDHI